MKIHELKTWPEPFAATLAGTKLHEFRRDDRDFAVDDLLVLREWIPGRFIPGELRADGSVFSIVEAPGRYTERRLAVRVLYIGRGFGIPNGFVCMSVLRVQTDVARLVVTPSGDIPDEPSVLGDRPLPPRR